MASERLTFTLEGRDDLSRVLGHAGESAQRLQRTMQDASDDSGQAILTLTRDADGRLRDMEGRFVSAGDAAALMGTRAEEGARSVTTWADAADRAGAAGEALKKSLLTLAPAAIPAAASIAPLAASAVAAGVGIGIFGLAVKKQITAMGEAVTAEQKYNDAVEQSGASSAEAVKAQMAYARQMAQLPPATRQAAALSVMKDEYSAWSDSLAKDTTGPLIKGMGALQSIFPKLTPTVRGAAEQLDRLVTVAAGGVASPGFDSFMARVDGWSTGALTRATDGLIRLLRSADQGKMSGGLSEFMQFAREQGPAVAETLGDVGKALLHVLDAGADVGVGMLPVIQALAELVAAVPPELLTTLLQLAIAIRAVTLAAAGAAAARAAIAALGTSLVGMRVAAAAAPGPLAAAGAAIMTLSRTARLALLGTGIGVLALVIGEIAAAGEEAPIDVDKMTSSLAKLGNTGKLTGTALSEFGAGFSGLGQTIGEVIDPSVMESFDNWLHDLPGGFFNAGEATEKFTEQSDAIDKSLASLVSGGKADLAAAALQKMLGSMDAEKAAKLRSSLDEYDDALGNVEFEARLAAEAQGIFGAQAQETQKKLDAQKASADGLRQSIFALTDVNRTAAGAMSDFEASIDNATELLKDHRGSLRMVGGELDLGSEKARKADAALRDLAAKAQAAAAAADEQGRSNEYVNGILDRGRQQLIKHAEQLGLDRQAADALARSYVAVPDKTARLKGNIEDLQAKLASAKSQLKSVPDGRKAQVRANISQLEGQLAEARRKLDALDGKTSVTYVKTYYSSDRIASPDGHAGPGGIPKYASGTDNAASGWALVGEEGPELVRMKGGEQVFDHLTSKKMARSMADFPGLSLGQQVGAGLSVGMLQSVGGVEAAARRMSAGIEAGIRSEMEIASPSKKSKRLMGHVGDGIKRGIAAQGPKLKDPMAALMKDLTGGIVRGLLGTKSQIQATAADLNKDIWAAFSKQKTTKDSDLVRFVNREHDKLQKLATERDRLKTRLASAQDLLKSRIDEQARYRADVRSRAQDSASLSSLGLDRQQVTAGTIRGGLQAKLAQLRQFNGYITRLIKRGLHKSLLRQVIAMGPEEGLPYAAALLGMTNQDFKQTNQMQASIDKESEALGRTSAKHFYDAGVNSAKGLVEGLRSQQKAIEKEMTDIARGMERALKKALGIKSPSRVAHGIGLNFGQGLSGGTRASLPLVGRAVDAVAGRMAGIRPMLGQPVAGLGAGPAAAAPIIANITITDAMDPVRVGQEVQKVLLKLKRVNGINVDLGVK
ncbi:hypothetical protein [Streptomyces filamentosus]|uniref:hypothetical protein n=1 Tax=Streptomyces filamentosus TaxID=67294 RepID=UPI00123B59DC|nr:hypothetical protein [Streptomyces filamentosus]KAA6211777.1 hypothetical protein CP979_36020 [Streptomyces filamentosus]